MSKTRNETYLDSVNTGGFSRQGNNLGQALTTTACYVENDLHTPRAEIVKARSTAAKYNVAFSN